MDDLPNLGESEYGAGWCFRAHYHLFTTPIPRDQNGMAAKIASLHLTDGPIQRLKNGKFRVRQAYFMNLSCEGLEIVRQASREEWPDWALLALQPSPRTNSKAESEDMETFEEGGRRSVMATVRNRELREAAFRKYGYKCFCCPFEFEEVYGEFAREVAIVHHLNTFHGLKNGKRIATVDDVRVVCANCHCVIHLHKEPMDVEELKMLVRRRSRERKARSLSES